jgi:hypothetical protein
MEYLKKKFDEPRRLIIATNYEETSFEYYLGCRTILGFLKSNLAQDTLQVPDVILYRSWWAWQNDQGYFARILDKSQYSAVRFPIFDYGVNNIPEINPDRKMLQHLFVTPTTTCPDRQLILYFRGPAMR